MPKASPSLQSFNAGELSPHVLARSDLQKYAAGSVRTENFLPLLEGPAERRPGTRFIAEAPGRCWLTPFQFDLERQYVLEWSHQRLRAYFGRQLVVGAAPPAPMEVVTPYTEADLTNPDGTLALSFAQSADVVYIAHPRYPLHVLSRVTANAFSLAEAPLRGGPFEDLHAGTVTLTASGQVGTVTVTASAPVFDPLDAPAHGRTLVYLEADNGAAIAQWVPGTTYNNGDHVRVGERIYRQVNGGAAVSGNVTPVHTMGQRADGGPSSCRWLYLHSGWGWGHIAAVASATSATVVVESMLPSTGATTRWALSLFRRRTGFAAAIALHRQRLVLAGRQWFAMSVSRDFLDFSARDADVQSADMSIVGRIDDGMMDDAVWLSSQDVLLVGTRGGEYAVSALSESEPLGPGNVAARVQSTQGSSQVAPLKVGAATLFVQRGGRRVRDTRYEFTGDGYATTDLTRLARHIARPSVVQMAWAQEPYGTVWVVRSDGVLLSLTYDREQDVVAWARHPRRGRDRSVAAIVAPDQASEDVYLAVERQVGAETRWHVEVMPAGWVLGQPPEAAWYVDAGVEVVSAVPVGVVGGLAHLEGLEVVILADGAVQPRRVVTGGQVTLQEPARRVIVGLPYRSVLRPVRIEAGAADGTSQGKTRRIHKIVFRLLASSGLARVGRTEASARPLRERHPSTPMDSLEAPADFEQVVPWAGGYGVEDDIVIVVDDPVPTTVAAVYPQIHVQDAR